jgi:hypothetical protein
MDFTGAPLGNAGYNYEDDLSLQYLSAAIFIEEKEFVGAKDVDRNPDADGKQEESED